jgi:DHA1 family inner membrane transport protein
MKNEKLLLFALALVQFTHIVDFMIIMPLGKQFMELFSISPGQFSLIVSSYAISAFVMGLLSAIYIDRVDRKVALLFIYTGFIIGTFACSMASSYGFFLAARCLTGAFGGILAALIFAIIGDTIPYERRSSATGIVMTAFSAASVAGVPAGIYLAASFGWRMTFIVVGIIAVLVLITLYYTVPSMQGHMNTDSKPAKRMEVFTNVLKDRNQLLALLFTVILMLGHFTIIPFIAPYMQFNIGFSDYQVTYIYAIGGTLTAVLLPVFGKIADRYGNALVFTISSLFALFSILAITNLPAVSLVVALCATSSFFIVASGRSVPATTMVTSVVKPEFRGSFMSIRSSVNQLALAMASGIAGLIIIEQEGKLINYPYVGYIAVGMSLLAVVLAWRLKAVS